MCLARILLLLKPYSHVSLEYIIIDNILSYRLIIEIVVKFYEIENVDNNNP